MRAVRRILFNHLSGAKRVYTVYIYIEFKWKIETLSVILQMLFSLQARPVKRRRVFFFFITIIDGCLKYKNKELPKTGPITICFLFYNSI